MTMSCATLCMSWSSFEDGRSTTKEEPSRNAMNEVLRDWYVGGCRPGCGSMEQVAGTKWPVRSAAAAGSEVQSGIGMYAGYTSTSKGSAHQRRVGTVEGTNGSPTEATKPI